MIIKEINCFSKTSVEKEYLCEEDCIQHRILKIEFNYKDERIIKLMQKIRDKALGTAFNPASSDGTLRSIDEQNIKSIAGYLAEEVMHMLLIKYNKQINKYNLDNVKIKLDTSKSSINQIDLKIQKTWMIDENNTESLTESIEVRSSFPFLPIETTVCKTFDVLGPYVNEIKIIENAKDYYLRLLFGIDYDEKYYMTYIDKNQLTKIDYNKTTINTLYQEYFDKDYLLKKNLVMYFVGGATNEMMNNPSISYYGSMESDIFNTEKNGLFKKIKLKNSLDAVSMIKLMLSVCTNENLDGK